MGHNPNLALMGATLSDEKEVTNHKGTIDAGVMVRLTSGNAIVIPKADGGLLGISIGKDLSGIGRTAVCRKGLRVPLKLTASFDPAIGGAVNISDTTGLGIAAGGGATTYNGVYSSGRIGGTGVNGGISENDKALVGCAYIDFPGGL